MRLLLVSVFISLAFLVLQIALSPKADAAYSHGRLIDNSLFLDANSMSSSQIQNFLNGKSGVLKSRSFKLDCDADGIGGTSKTLYLNAGAPCGSTVPASQIIYYTAQIYGISPKVILATLQKEQSLITDSSPSDRAIRQAMGYACPTSGVCDTNSSFFWQIDNATWVLRYHYERANRNNSWWDNRSWTCSTAKASYYTPNLYPGQTVNFIDPYSGINYVNVFINNAATSALYCYTPHVFNNHTNSPHPNDPKGSQRCYSSLPASGDRGRCYTGSYNFVTTYESWFGPVTVNVVRAKADDGSPTQYVIYGGKKQGIPSNDVLYAWGIDKLPLETFPAATLSTMTSYSGNLSRYIKYTNGEPYLVDDGNYYHASKSTVRDLWNFPSTPASVGKELFALLHNNGDLSPFVTPEGSSTIAIINSTSEMFLFSNTTSLHAWFNGENIIPISDRLYGMFSEQNVITHNRITDGTKDYVVVDGGRYTLPAAMGTSYPFSGSEIGASSELVAYLKDRGNLQRFVRSDYSGTVYLLDNGTLRGIPSTDILERYLGEDTSTVSNLGTRAFDLLSKGDPLRTSFVQDRGTNEYFLLEGKVALPIPENLEEAFGVSTKAIKLDHNNIERIGISEDEATPLVTSPESPAVFVLDEGKRYGISNPTTLKQFLADGKSITNITHADLLGYESVRNIANYLTDGDDRYFIDKGVKYPTTQALAADWGLTEDHLTTLSPELLDYFTTSTSPLANYVNITGKSYLVSSGRKYEASNPYSTLWGFNGSPSITLSTNSLYRVGDGGKLDKYAAKGGSIYTVDSSSLTGIASLQALFNLGYTNQAIVNLSDNLFSDLPTSDVVLRGPLVKDGSEKCYVLDGGMKRTPKTDSLSDWCFNLAEAPMFSSTYLNTLPGGGALTKSIRAQNDTTLYGIDEGKKRWIPSNNIYNSYFSPFSSVGKYLRDLLPSGTTVGSDGN